MSNTPIKPVFFRKFGPIEGRPPAYRLFTEAPNAAAVVLQTHCPETGEPTPATELKAYRTKTMVSTPWGQVRARSLMLLSESAARFLFSAGTITPVPESPFPRRLLPTPPEGAKQ